MTEIKNYAKEVLLCYRLRGLHVPLKGEIKTLIILLGGELNENIFHDTTSISSFYGHSFVIYVPKTHTQKQKNFESAKILSHRMLILKRMIPCNFDSQEDNQEKIEAFALELMVPSKEFAKEYQKNSEIRHLSDFFEVPEEEINKRIFELKRKKINSCV